MYSKEFIYLDNAATTFCSRRVTEALAAFYTLPHGNPSAVHRLGFESQKLLSQCREFFASLFKVVPEQVIFTASGTEANNLALSGILKKKERLQKRPVILVSPVEHASVMRNVEAWAECGYEIQKLEVDSSGKVLLDDLEKKLSDRIALVSVMAVNNELGTIEPISQIGKLIQQKDENILFHVDAVQAFGKIPIQFNEWNVDLMTMSSHKIHGPVGAGALIMGEKARLSPLILGGGQEFGLRSGTESLGMIHGFSVAAREVMDGMERSHALVRRCYDRLRSGIEKLVFQKKIHSPVDGSPYIFNVSFPGYPSEVVLRMLEQEKIYVSAGSSCNMKRKKPSGILSAIGCCYEEMTSAIRFSFSSYTKESEIEDTLKVLHRILDHLSRIA